jgi:predicted nucleic acid-binding Zn ribbon protein
MRPPPRKLRPLGPPKSSARQRVLAQWRGVDTAPEERAREVSAKSAAEILLQVKKSLRLDQRRANLEVLKVWNHLLDPMITAHAQPTGLRNGTLFISVDSNVQLNELVRFRRKEILDRLQSSFGREFIKKLSFRVLG